MKPALRYRCALKISIHCTAGTGMPTRKTCAHCGGAIRREQGLYGVFVWSQTDGYRLGDAIRTFASQPRAQALCDSETGRAGNYVTGWIPA